MSTVASFGWNYGQNSGLKNLMARSTATSSTVQPLFSPIVISGHLPTSNASIEQWHIKTNGQHLFFQHSFLCQETHNKGSCFFIGGTWSRQLLLHSFIEPRTLAMIIWRILKVLRVRGFMQKIWTSLIRCKPRPWYLLFSFVLFRPNIVLWYPEVALAGAPRWKPCNCWSEPNGIVVGARQEKWNPKLKFQTGPPPIDFIFKPLGIYIYIYT